MSDKPLISVVVLTYNSARYVEATLDSIYRQTYDGAIELIIGDDCSTDDTVSVCKKWLSRNNNRFVHSEIIRPSENQGVVRNINTCYKACSGEWVKDIAGDDILLPHALDTLYHEAISHKVSFVYSALRTFSNHDDLSKTEQLKYVAGGPCDKYVDLEYVYKKPSFWLNAPTFLVSAKLLKKIEYVPELFRNIEDRPLFAKALAAGYKIWHSSEATVLYRIHGESITATIESRRYAECNWLTYKIILRPCFHFFQAIDVDLRMLPLWQLSKQGKKDFVYRIFRLLTQILWLVYRLLTFALTLRPTKLKPKR